MILQTTIAAMAASAVLASASVQAGEPLYNGFASDFLRTSSLNCASESFESQPEETDGMMVVFNQKSIAFEMLLTGFDKKSQGYEYEYAMLDCATLQRTVLTEGVGEIIALSVIEMIETAPRDADLTDLLGAFSAHVPITDWTYVDATSDAFRTCFCAFQGEVDFAELQSSFHGELK